jgi:DNA-binding MarR family transcriptional regulator
MYRLNRLLAVAGSLVVRLCEGGYGITRREWGLLMMLAQHPGMPPAELAQRLGLDRARTSRAITSLLAKKLITRATLPGDRRQARLSLTPAGNTVHDDLFPQIKALNQELLAGLDTEAVRMLDQALSSMQQRAEALVATRTDVPRTYRLRGGRHVD